MKWTNVRRLDSSEKTVAKYVFDKYDAVAETVLYKYPTYKDRTVICCSVQSGCPVGCRFCGSGDFFNRSLTWEEIVDQIECVLQDACAEECISSTEIAKLQIMFMSMGEPLMNIDELITALEYLSSCHSNAKLLISTSAPRNDAAFKKLFEVSKRFPQIGLQFSVHESTDEARQKLIPSPTCSLKEIARYGEEWAKITGRRPFFNYCVHEGNNKELNALQLFDHFDTNVWECTLSVICERDENVAAANERQKGLVSEFMAKMLNLNYSVRMFNPAGQDDIGGGCGQLWYVQDWMEKHPKNVKRSAGYGKDKVHTPK